MTDADYRRSVDECSDALFRYALKLVRDRDLAKDVVQECFLRLWMRLDTVEAEKVRSYLFTIAHHYVVSHVRKYGRMRRWEPWHENDRTVTQGEPRLREHLDRALGALPPVQRSVILLRDLEGHSYEDIAQITGLSLSQVKVYIYRGRKALQGNAIVRELAA